MKNKLMLIFVLAGSAFLLLYTTIAARPIAEGLSIIPEWSVFLTEMQPVPNKSIHPVPFFGSKTYGYISAQGTVLLKNTITAQAAISTDFCADFESDSDVVSVFNPAGEKVTELKAAGFPFFQENRLYMFFPGGCSVAEYDATGKQKWLYENYAPITAFNSSKNGAVIGFADGNLTGLKSDGTKQFSFYPGGSTYQVIYGAAISLSGNMSAAVSGLENQRVIVTKYANGQNKIFFHEYIAGSVNSQTLVQFSATEDTVFFDDANGLGVLDCTAPLLRHIPLAGKILSIQELADDIVTVFSLDENVFRVSIIEGTRYLIGSFEFPAQTAFAAQHGESLFISKDDTVSKLTFVRR